MIYDIRGFRHLSYAVSLQQTKEDLMLKFEITHFK